jgi:hypothetical protein
MYEDFTTFTEVDIAADRIQKTANHIDHRAERDETTYLYKDYGAAHFGDFEHKIKAKMVSGDAGGQSAAWMLANDLGNYKALSDGSKTYIYLRLQHNATDDQVSLIEVNSGTSYKDHNVDGFGLGDWIYAKLVKSGTSLTCYLYSDSGYSTLVDTLSLTLHADHSFRYLYGCNTYNDASNFHIITDVENFDIGETKTKASSIGLSVKESKTKTSSIGLEVVPPLSYEDFTTFTEVDVGADRIQKTKYHIDHLSYRDETTYLYKDYGAACFGDFEHRIKVRVVSTSEAWSGGHTWLLANDVAGAYWMESNNKTYLSIFLISNGSNNPRILLREMYNGTYYDDEYICSLNTWYYVKIIKSGTSINAYVYSDSDYSNLVDTLTLTLHANHTLQYLYGCNSDNDGSGKNGTLDILNFNIGETKTKASSIGLSIKDYGAMGCVMTSIMEILPRMPA